MNRFNSSGCVWRLVALFVLFFTLPCISAAQSGSWTEPTGDGAWENSANWSSGTIANGSGNTASFTAVNVSGDAVNAAYPGFYRNAVRLDTTRTIGNLSFADANPASPGGWELYTGNSSGLVLAGTTPTITVGPLGPYVSPTETIDDVVIRPVISGIAGLTKMGSGILTLNSGGSFNTFTGGININEGTLRILSVVPGQAINIANGATLSTIQELRAVPDTGPVHTINVPSGATVNIISNNNLGNIAAAGATINLSVPTEGATVSPNDSWAVNGAIARLNVSAPGTGGNFRLRNNAGLFNGASFLGTHVDLNNITMWTRTNTNGNIIDIGALSGSATAILSGGGQGGGTIATYSIGSLNTDTVFAGTIDTASATDPDGGLNLTKIGTGKLTLSGTLNYAPLLNGAAAGNPDLRGGITTISTGTLALANSAAIAGGFTDVVNGDLLTTVNVLSAGTLDVSGYTAGTYSTSALQQVIGSGTIVGSYNHDQGFLRPGNTLTGTNPTSVAGVSPLTFANNLSFTGSGEITYDMAVVPGSSNDHIQVNGITNLTGSSTKVTPNFLSSPPTSGTYTILTSTGGFTGTPADWTVAWPGRGAAPSVVVSGNQLQFTAVPITGGDNLNWTGTSSGNWDVNGTTNWYNNTDSIADKYFNGDIVTFADTANGNPVSSFTVSVPSAVSPGSVTVNSTGNYTISGAGAIAGAGTFTKRGSSTLTMQKANTFSGQATIEAGTVNIGNFNGALGTGQLHLNGGTVVGINNGLTNSAVVVNSGSSTIQSNNATALVMPALSGSGNLLVTSNDDNLRVDLAGAVNSYSGNVTFGPDGVTSTAMTIRLAGAANDLPAAAVTLRNGAVMANRNGSGTIVTMELGSLTGDSTTALQAFSGGGTTPGTNWQIGGLNSSTAFAGIIRDNSATVTTSLTKVGTGTLTLSAVSTYTGSTSVNAGTLSISNAYLADATDVNLLNGALFNLNFVGTDTIDSLFFNGVSQAEGTWGRLGHPTANFTSGLISGDGLLQVLNFVPPAQLTGDYNGNNVVDAADFTIWRDRLGQTFALTNRDLANTGPISMADYNSWKANFGMTAGAGGYELSGVPEPATWLLVALATAIGGGWRRRR